MDVSRFLLSAPLHRRGALLVLLAAFAPAALAQLRFDRGALFVVGPEPSASAVADVNADGIADVLTLNRTFNRLSYARGGFDPVTHDWFGTAVPGDSRGSGGGGGYGSSGGSGSDGPPGFVTPAEPVDLAVADFVLDGECDVLVVGRSGGRVAVRYASQGTFLGPVEFPCGTRPFRVRCSDFDRDGDADAFVASEDAVRVLEGTPTGLLAPLVVHAAVGGRRIAGFDLVDTNGDGNDDLVVVSQHPYGLDAADATVRLGDGAGGFDMSPQFEIHPALTLVVDVRVGDIDGNDTQELVVASYPHDLFVRPIGAGLPRVVPTEDTQFAVQLFDFDGDRLQDVVTTSSGTLHSLNVFYADGHGGVQDPLRFQVGPDPARFAIADVDGDARRDVIVPTAGIDEREAGAFELYLNRSGRFRDAGTVNAGEGPLADVVFVNGSTGGPLRRVDARVGQRLRIDVLAPPASRRSAPLALFVWEADPMRGQGSPLPHGIGETCLPTPMAPGGPQPVFGWNASGRPDIAPYLAVCGPAPCVPLNLRRGLGEPTTLFIQGVIADPASAGERAVSVTNGVLLEVR